jgi:hypothetical protein
MGSLLNKITRMDAETSTIEQVMGLVAQLLAMPRITGTPIFADEHNEEWAAIEFLQRGRWVDRENPSRPRIEAIIWAAKSLRNARRPGRARRAKQKREIQKIERRTCLFERSLPVGVIPHDGEHDVILHPLTAARIRKKGANVFCRRYGWSKKPLRWQFDHMVQQAPRAAPHRPRYTISGPGVERTPFYDGGRIKRGGRQFATYVGWERAASTYRRRLRWCAAEFTPLEPCARCGALMREGSMRILTAREWGASRQAKELREAAATLLGQPLCANCHKPFDGVTVLVAAQSATWKLRRETSKCPTNRPRSYAQRETYARSSSI